MVSQFFVLSFGDRRSKVIVDFSFLYFDFHFTFTFTFTYSYFEYLSICDWCGVVWCEDLPEAHCFTILVSE